ncbi:MAG: amidohydrolase family protein, partial [Gemmatimonadetes bacterium]|nr:amidohydrolase family protein [Gemmatimonadota bacterium]
MGRLARPLLVVADRIHTFSDSGSGAGAEMAGLSEPAQALVVRDGRIAAVGPLDEMVRQSRDADRLDLAGCTITPGLTDAHLHLLEWALARGEVDLSGADSVAAAARLAGGFARERRGAAGEWLRGHGWNPHRWGGAYPDRQPLDAAVPDRPVVLQSHDMHALWLNAAALARAGIDRDTPDPDGGRIVRDAAGTPTGVLLENAMQLVTRVLPLPSDAALRGALLQAQVE